MDRSDLRDEWRDEWESPWEVVEAMVARATTARLNRKQRAALRILLAKLTKFQSRRAAWGAELEAVHAERKRLRRALDDMRQERDRERKRAESAEARQGRVGCGKVPVRNAAEAWEFIDLVCSKTGESPQEYEVYACRTCEPRGDMLVPYHIGHVVSRAERAKRESGEAVDLEEARRRLRSCFADG